MNQDSATDASSARDFDTVSMGSIDSTTSIIQRKFSIELTIKLLFVSDQKYFGEHFKIDWAQGKKRIDTKVAKVNPDTQIAKFVDKFSMKTNLHWDEENNAYRPKPSSLQVFWLEKELVDGRSQLTGKKTQIGFTSFSLSDYINRSVSAEKLYLEQNPDFYIEISVKSKSADQARLQQTIPTVST